MELLLLLVIAIVLCLILGVQLNYIIIGIVGLVGVVCGLFTVAFLGCGVCLLGAKRKEARFLRMDKAKRGKFQVAVYLVEGKEYPCIFPKEAVLEDKLYRTDKIYYVMLHSGIGRVFDRFAIATCILGLVAGTILSIGIFVVF